MNILMVLTSHDQLGDTGKKTGFWLEEFAAPHDVFKDTGATLTLVSPKGGQPPLDPKSDAPDAQADATKRFQSDDVVPFLVRDQLVSNGGMSSKAANWQPDVVTDGALITGQNPASSEPAARALLQRQNKR